MLNRNLTLLIEVSILFSEFDLCIIYTAQKELTLCGVSFFVGWVQSLFGQNSGFAAAKSLAGAVFQVFLLFTNVVFPLMSVFVFFPACAVMSAPPEIVKITYAQSIFDKFAAGHPPEEKSTLVVVEIFCFTETNDMFCFCSRSFNWDTIVIEIPLRCLLPWLMYFLQRGFSCALLLRASLYTLYMTWIVSSADEAAIAENNSFLNYWASQSVIEVNNNGFHGL